jgi:hypothetical protein
MSARGEVSGARHLTTALAVSIIGGLLLLLALPPSCPHSATAADTSTIASAVKTPENLAEDRSCSPAVHLPAVAPRSAEGVRLAGLADALPLGAPRALAARHVCAPSVDGITGDRRHPSGRDLLLRLEIART